MKFNEVCSFEAEAAKSAKKIFTIEKGSLEEQVPDDLKALATANNFIGESGTVLASPDAVLLGVGDKSDPFVYAALREHLPAGDYVLADELTAQDAKLAVLGWLMGGYQFTRYKKPSSERSARLIAPENVDVAEIKRDAQAIFLVRDLVNTPASDLLPDAMETAAREIAETYKAEINVTTGDDLLAENFPMIHAVGRASVCAPRLIDIQWGDKDAPKVTLVGKGVCFDSGGLNIKGGAGMALMKKDMGGAAHVLALGQMLMSAGINIRLRILISAVENAISGNAFRPSDILASRSGLSVEIGNTDAEGRLVLADALTLAGDDKPELTISLATLTGAARVAVGPDLAPFYCDDENTALEISKEGDVEADPVWRMPLWKGYEPMLNSPVADLNNAPSGGFAGSITAALFLKRFAPDNAPWVHFDIYAWRPKSAPGRPAGGEAMAIRALFRVISKRFA